MIYTITTNAGQMMFGLSSDSKPTACLNGSSFFEIDTGRCFFLVSGVWAEKTAVPTMVTGNGGTVTQATSKATGVTLNKMAGAITMHNATLAAAAEVTFIVTNSTIGANDVVVVNHKSAGTAGAYAVFANTIAAGSFRVTVGNMSAGSLGEAIVLQFSIIKSVTT